MWVSLDRYSFCQMQPSKLSLLPVTLHYIQGLSLCMVRVCICTCDPWSYTSHRSQVYTIVTTTTTTTTATAAACCYSGHLLHVDHVLDTVLEALHMLYLILSTTVQVKCYYIHFIYGKTEDGKKWNNLLGSHSWCVTDLDSNAGSLWVQRS